MQTKTQDSQTDDHAMVLLVDDQPFVGEVVRRFFAEEPKIDLHYCSDPNEALRLAEQLRPTVILQDLVMPGVDGLSIVGRFRAQPATKSTPIIVLSTKEEASTKSLAFSVGANDYLVKLPDKIELIARVRYHSKAYLIQLQRDEAYRALRESQQQLLESNTALLSVNQKLGEALSQVKQLHGLLPLCCYCKRVRDDKNYWSQIDSYLAAHSDLQISHGICEDCFESKSDEMGISKERAAEVAAQCRQRTGLTVAA